MGCSWWIPHDENTDDSCKHNVFSFLAMLDAARTFTHLGPDVGSLLGSFILCPTCADPRHCSCPLCYGTGRQDRGGDPRGPNDPYTGYQFTKCLACHGSGRSRAYCTTKRPSDDRRPSDGPSRARSEPRRISSSPKPETKPPRQEKARLAAAEPHVMCSSP